MTHSNFKRSVLGCAAALAFSIGAATFASAQSADTSLQSAVVMPSDFSRFTPRPSKATKIDYAMFDEALTYIVIDLGPSLRTRASKPQATTGSRFVRGHTSPYRMEGNRVTFDYITEGFVEGLRDYRMELEEIGTRIDIATLSRDEQLAYWFNLHNVALLEKVAENYPIDRPSNVKVKIGDEKYPLTDAKFLTVKAQPLSLRDIRENIVYKNWDDPMVIYGFYRGDIGSPKLQDKAFAANRLDYFLEDNAIEFVNSLRGFRKGTQSRYISEIYRELDGTYFTDFDKELHAHLLKYARDEVREDVQSGRPFKFEKYESMISDLTGGRRLASSGNALQGAGVMPREVEQFMREAYDKRRTLINNGMIKPRVGYVIIEDIIPEEEETSSNPE
ncbi:MAG: DUF547 domain-containing protein [Hellea sp.]|nr:DUF547 domain-containing protein [Hellea sp.]